MEDRQKVLESFTDRELVDELKRRYAVLAEVGALLAGPVMVQAKNRKMSEAKAAYWRDWHEYKTAHPDATLEQWRRSQRRSKK